MPKRVIDGDALWVSEKLLSVPEEFRVEYAWLLPLAQANGCFECSSMLVWRTCYSALRPEWKIEDVAAMLDAFEAAKMLFRFQRNGKTYGFFVGAEKEGRLQKPSDRTRVAKPWNTGMLPADALAAFLTIPTERVQEEFRDLLAESPQNLRPISAEFQPLGNGNGRDGDGEEVMGEESDEVREKVNNTVINTARKPLHSSTHNSKQKHTTKTQTAFISDDSVLSRLRAKGILTGINPLAFAKLFHRYMDDNDSSDNSKIPSNWEDVWEKDFEQLLAQVSPAELVDILIVSQLEKNKQYYVRPKKLVDNLTLLRTMVKESRKALPTLRSALAAQKPTREEFDDIESV